MLHEQSGQCARLNGNFVGSRLVLNRPLQPSSLVFEFGRSADSGSEWMFEFAVAENSFISAYSDSFTTAPFWTASR